MFEDKTVFIATSRENTWNTMPRKYIQYINYVFPNNQRVILEGFDSYNHLIEHCMLLLGGNNETVWSIRLIGRYKNNITEILYNTRTNSITKNEYKSEDYLKADGWRAGLILPMNRITKCDIIDL
jgi:hypothetical protein